MKLPGLPTPADVRSALEQGTSLLPRILRLLEQAEGLVVDAAALLVRIERTRTDVDRVVRSAAGTAAAADLTVQDAGRLVAVADGVAATADVTVSRAVLLLDLVEPRTRRVVALLHRVDELTADHSAEEVVHLVEQLRTVAPDLAELLEVSRELNEMLGHLPGMGRIKKRVEAEDEAGADAAD